MLYRLNRATAITAIFVACALCALLAQATGISESSVTQAEPGAVLVELFTSEAVPVGRPQMRFYARLKESKRSRVNSS
jgi:hypothetical protein